VLKKLNYLKFDSNNFIKLRHEIMEDICNRDNKPSNGKGVCHRVPIFRKSHIKY